MTNNPIIWDAYCGIPFFTFLMRYFEMTTTLGHHELEEWFYHYAGSRLSFSVTDSSFAMVKEEKLAVYDPTNKLVEVVYPTAFGGLSITCQLALVGARLCLSSSSFACILYPVAPESIQQNQWFLAHSNRKSKGWVDLVGVQRSLDKFTTVPLPNKPRRDLIQLVNARAKAGLEPQDFTPVVTTGKFTTSLIPDLASIWGIIEWHFNGNRSCESSLTAPEVAPIDPLETTVVVVSESAETQVNYHQGTIMNDQPQTKLAKLFVANFIGNSLLGVVLDDANKTKGRIWYYWPHVWKSLEYGTGGAGSRFTQLQDFSQEDGLLQLVQTIRKDDETYEDILNAFNLNALEQVSQGENLDFSPRNGIRLISVEGLIHLVLKMQTDKAKVFQAHVFKIVASVMQHGCYIDPEYRKLLKVGNPVKPPISSEEKLMNGYVRTLRKEVLALEKSQELLQRMPEAIQAFLDRLRGI